MGNSTRELFSRSNSYHTSTDASLFSASLPVLSHDEFNGKKIHDNDDNHYAIESLLPDEDELLAGMVDGLVDESDEYDIFGNGGLELESDLQENLKLGFSGLNITDNGDGAHFNLTNSVGPIVGEHPLGEHPSRTLFVRNINSNVEDVEIRTLFEQYGDIRTLYSACKHRGFVMISYFDIRAAKSALRGLQNKPLRRRKLDIHFSIPKENPTDKDLNQGTLVAFNLDPSVSNDELRQIFGAYGEVKEIRETPHKRHHKFIEFYDVRAAEAALKSLNRSDIAGKRVKLEPSRPGGARRSSLMYPNNDLDQDEWNLQHVGSPLGNSPPGIWPQLGSPFDRNSLKNFSKSPVFSSTSSPLGSSVPGLASLLNHKVGHTSNSHYMEHIFANRNSNGQGGIFEQSRSFPEQNLSRPVSSFSSSSFTRHTGPPLIWGNNGFNFLNHHNYHVGSAPPAAPLEPTFSYFHEAPKGPKVAPGYEGLGSSYNGSPIFRTRLSPVFLGNSHFNGLVAGSSMEGGYAERRSRPFEIKGIQLENNKQFQIDLDKIKSGADTRTTLMIKNIPNKYTSKMLMDSIDEHYKGTYDFLYLPIDFKNKCNVGYAFINMLSPPHIIQFYEEFNDRKWEKFNSEKVASLAFARIQGKTALVAHFQNSSLMNEDKRCRPILFDSEHTEFGDKIDLRAYNLSKMNGSNGISFPGQTLENMSGYRVEDR
ncbi:hypothetical protein CASFOL_039343 [Castilleja foliolosa]|uniref:RRM domain-containing protein n=1 Tax=Castilleja foliolosa TaxID=1961234 RepID=A0ABD3BI82_9LAMI